MPVKREWGVNPLRYTVAVCIGALRPSAKAGHWETEKAGAMRGFFRTVRVRRPALPVFRKMFFAKKNRFYLYAETGVLCRDNLCSSQESSCGNLRIAAAFLFAARKEDRNCHKSENHPTLKKGCYL